MVDAIEKQVSEQQWIGGASPSLADREAFDLLKAAPSVESHPHAFSWWCLCARFSPAIRESWTAAVAAPAKGGKKEGGKKQEKPKAAPAKKAEADDDFDPFADDGEDDSEAIAAMKKKAEDAKAKAVKKVPVAKSLIVWEVKPYTAETDIDLLAKKILAIDMEGLSWKTEYKKEPVAFGVFKLQIGATIVDSLISTDEVQEKIEELKSDEPPVQTDDDEEEDDGSLVQSVDILVFNKL